VQQLAVALRNSNTAVSAAAAEINKAQKAVRRPASVSKADVAAADQTQRIPCQGVPPELVERHRQLQQQQEHAAVQHGRMLRDLKSARAQLAEYNSALLGFPPKDDTVPAATTVTSGSRGEFRATHFAPGPLQKGLLVYDPGKTTAGTARTATQSEIRTTQAAYDWHRNGRRYLELLYSDEDVQDDAYVSIKFFCVCL
jgi:hypothetical protein